MKNGLLVGGQSGFLGRLAEEIRKEDISLFIAVSLDDVKRIFENEAIDIVIFGYEHEPDCRLQVLRHIFSVSPSSSIHLMGKSSDPLDFTSELLL